MTGKACLTKLQKKELINIIEEKNKQIVQQDQANRLLKNKLQERELELNSLIQFSKLINEKGDSSEEILAGFPDIIKQIWHESKLVSVKLCAIGNEYTSDQFRRSNSTEKFSLSLHGYHSASDIPGEGGILEIYFLDTDQTSSKDTNSNLSEWKYNLVNKLINRLEMAVNYIYSTENLKESEEKYRALFNNAPLSYQSLDKDGKFLDVNPAWLRTLGYTKDEVIGSRYIDYLHPDYKSHFRKNFPAFKKSGYVHDVQFRIRHKEGHYLHISFEGCAGYHPDGRFKQTYCVFKDITEQKNAEEELLQNQFYLKKSQEIGKIGTWELDLEKDELMWTEQNYRNFGVANGTAANYELFLDRVHPADRAYVHQKWMAALQHEPYDIEHRILVDGKIRWVREKAEVEFDENGNAIKGIGLTQDITERKETEEKERIYVERLELAAETAKLGYYDWEPKTNRTHWDSGLVQIYEYDPKKHPGHYEYFESILHPDDKEMVLSEIRNGINGHIAKVKYMMEYRILIDNRIKHIESHATLFRNESGQVTRVVGTCFDIREKRKMQLEKKELEEKLQQSQKMEAIGTLAGGIAHDFNNILGVIFGYAEMTSDICVNNSEIQDNLEQILKASERARDMVEQILTFSRQSDVEKRPLNLVKLVSECRRFLKSSVPSTVKISFESSEKSAPVMGDYTQLNQVLMNLATNSVQSLTDKKGEIRIKIAIKRISTVKCWHNEIKAGLYYQLSISDNGCGIPEKDLEKIFLPYFTTKSVGEGTGLGLAVVYGIVKEHGGDIHVISDYGRGTTFDILIPALEAAEVEKEMLIKQHILPGNGERILLVDDEPALLEIVKTMLSSMNYKIDAISDSMEALAYFRENGQKIDLVISDMTMPKMTGLEMGIEIHKISPNLPMILCTGFSDRLNKSVAFRNGFEAFLMKPLRKDELGETIQRLLNAT